MIAHRYRSHHGFDFGSERDEDLERLARHRYGDTLPDSDEGRRFALVMAHHLGEPDSIRAYLDRVAPWYDEDDADKLIKAVIKKRYRWSADTLASTKWLAVSYAERQMLGLKTIGAYDMTKQQRTALRRERYRDQQRQMNRAYQADQRRAKGVQPRAAWLQANSISREKPWLAAGVSRATWYRNRETGPWSTYTSYQRNQMDLSHHSEQAACSTGRPAGEGLSVSAPPSGPCKPKHWISQTCGKGRVVVSDRLATPAERLAFMASQTSNHVGR